MKIQTQFEPDAGGWSDIMLSPWRVGERIAVQTPTRRMFVRVAKCERVRIEGGKIQGRSCAEPLRSEELVISRCGGKAAQAFIVKFQPL
ncbi:MAG: hypothetical protein IJI37_06435 [Opitutales bacterium]|nr:hypothetical protein [Opitutales bacterium]